MGRVSVVDTGLKFAAPLPIRTRTEYFVIHHIGRIPKGLPLSAITAACINDWHIQDRGWSAIGYHYVILPSGRIERGRPRDIKGAHDEGENACTIGICVVGDFGKENPTTAQIDALCGLLADLHDIYGLDAEREYTITGHRDNEPPETRTECPGDNLYRLLPGIRGRVIQLCK